jgi:hypothetical protein
MEDLKRMSLVFWAATAGIIVCLGGTITTALRNHHQAQAIEAQVGKIPVPSGLTAPTAPAAPNGIPVPAR